MEGGARQCRLRSAPGVVLAAAFAACEHQSIATHRETSIEAKQPIRVMCHE